MSNDICIYICDRLFVNSVFFTKCLGFFYKTSIYENSVLYEKTKLFFVKELTKEDFTKNLDKEKLQYFSYKLENKDASLLNPLLSV